jgi:predicted RNase H-like nuclease (RuvC/YqgF family)
MTLNSLRELENTRKKLQELEQQYETARQEASGNRYAHDLELRSLMGLINQLKEEIVRCECRVTELDPLRKGG